MAIHHAAAEHGGLIKKEIKKESSWVKLKAFPTNVGRPNKYYLRQSRHEFITLTQKIGHMANCSFITRLLYRDCY